MKTVLEDMRKIKALHCDLGEETHSFFVGEGGITRIEAYAENGHMALVPWFAVYKGEEIAVRMDGLGKTVCYS